MNAQSTIETKLSGVTLEVAQERVTISETRSAVREVENTTPQRCLSTGAGKIHGLVAEWVSYQSNLANSLSELQATKERLTQLFASNERLSSGPCVLKTQ